MGQKFLKGSIAKYMTLQLQKSLFSKPIYRKFFSHFLKSILCQIILLSYKCISLRYDSIDVGACFVDMTCEIMFMVTHKLQTTLDASLTLPVAIAMLNLTRIHCIKYVRHFKTFRHECTVLVNSYI